MKSKICLPSFVSFLILAQTYPHGQNTAYASEHELIRYEHVAQIFENRCSACHNEHMQQRNGLPSWSNASVATSRRGAFQILVVDTEMMPKKWSEKFRDWPTVEQKLFQGWLDNKSFLDAGISSSDKIPPLAEWSRPSDEKVEQIFKKNNCLFCLDTTSQMTVANRHELGNQIYWRVFYLGLPPNSDDDRQQLLRWTFDDLVTVASWLKMKCETEVSPQWIKVRASLGRQ